jgi:hypothetical protein
MGCKGTDHLVQFGQVVALGGTNGNHRRAGKGGLGIFGHFSFLLGICAVRRSRLETTKPPDGGLLTL